jgi:hypothetical protein
MPTTLSTFNAAAGEIKVRYLEPYVTEGLNAKFAGVVPRGTHRGFRLTTNAGALTVTIQSDPVYTDHVAQYLTSDGHALTIRRVGGNFSAALGASTTWIIAIFATYSIGATTTAVLNAYTQAEFNALSTQLQQELIVLGVVTTPASGVIAATSITHSMRVWAGRNIGQDAIPFLRIADDPGFSQVGQGILGINITNLTHGPWTLLDFSTGVTGIFNPGDPATKNQLTLSVAASGTFSFAFYQSGANQASVQQGQTLRARIDLKVLQVISSGTLQVAPIYRNAAGTVVTPTDAAVVTTGAIDTNYRTIDVTFTVPPTAVFVAIALQGINLVCTTGNVVRINNFQSYIETLGTDNESDGGMRSPRAIVPVLRIPPSLPPPQASDPIVANLGSLTGGGFQGTGGTPAYLALLRADNKVDAAHPQPRVAFSGGLDLGNLFASEMEPRLQTSVVTGPTYTLLWTSTNNAGAGFAVYASGNLGEKALVLCYNAFWSSTTSQWTVGYNSFRVYIGTNGISLQRSNTTVNATLADSAAWVEAGLFAGDFQPSIVHPAMAYFRGLLDTAVHAGIPRLQFPTISQANLSSPPRRTLLFETSEYTQTFCRTTRFYATELNPGYVVLELVQGAKWNPGAFQWVQDSSTSDPTSKLTFGTTNVGTADLVYSVSPSGSTTWGESQWNNWSLGNSGSCKAWGNISTTGSGGVSAVGYNLAHMTASNLSSTDVTVVLKQGVTSLSVGPGYPVFCSATQASGIAVNFVVGAYNFTSTGFLLRTFQANSGVIQNPTTSQINLYFAAFAPDHISAEISG